MKLVPLLAPPFESYDPESFHLYAKSLEKPWKPKETKTRKRKTDDPNPKPRTSRKKASPKTDDGNINAPIGEDQSSNKFFLSISNK